MNIMANAGAIIIVLRERGYPTPGGRRKSYSKQSGERFREEQLKPAIQKALNSNRQVVIDLDGSTGGTSSFYDEAIGALIRCGMLTEESASSLIEIRATESKLQYIKTLVKLVIQDARL